MRRVAGLLALAGLAVGPAGCGKDEFQKVYPVKGKVLVDGKAAHECMVTLHRTFDDPHPRKVIPYALTDEGGGFQITSYVTGDGAPEGEYVVTIEWKMRSGVLQNNFDGPDLLDGAYANKDANRTRSGYLVKVGREPLDIPTYDIRLSPQERQKMEDIKRKAAKRPTLGGGEPK